jgi:all-trans-retinol dehydrogenase (NAD+)
MIEKNHGHIVTVASVAGIFGSAGICDYSASKGATIAFDDSLRIELVRLKKKGVRTTCVCPYLIDTGMFQGASPGYFYLTPF